LPSGCMLRASSRSLQNTCDGQHMKTKPACIMYAHNAAPSHGHDRLRLLVAVPHFQRLPYICKAQQRQPVLPVTAYRTVGSGARGGGGGKNLAVIGSMLKMRQDVKSARPAMSADEMLQGTLGKHAYTCKRRHHQHHFPGICAVITCDHLSLSWLTKRMLCCTPPGPQLDPNACKIWRPILLVAAGDSLVHLGPDSLCRVCVYGVGHRMPLCPGSWG
jgi:hypothetical protein